MKRRHFLVALAILALDQGTKWLAVRELAGGRDLEIVPGFLRLSYVENTGVAFGLFDGAASPWKPWILGGLALAAIATIILYGLHAPKERKLLHLALAGTLGGVAGNLVDRVARYVSISSSSTSATPSIGRISMSPIPPSRSESPCFWSIP